MDFDWLIVGGLSLLAATMFLLGLSAATSRRQALENYGESRVRRRLTVRFGGPEYHLLNNVTLPFEDGTTQVDHILVSLYGVFVIETKHYTGWIFGATKSPEWTQVIYQTRSSFRNPLKQNARHVRAVCGLLDFIPAEHVQGLVVFTGDAEFKTPRPDGVVGLKGLVRHIRSCQDEVMSQNRMQFCVGRLECRRRELSRMTDIEHQAYLERKYGRAD